ncbi:uncharacterized protein A4U43_C08F12950 [Asparagus officinalis]|uniref:probable E3 ubiquitin-protein ligase RHY1A n=1 Tax=Asparagus officinalis TaxID=4686 RepID=UPI00098DE360|nr:probable E3 ubiquitin-protein ligase RHY1A [Asparagus officinalis]ONK59980.1 uncharacterized protein A4U43_C08F12950 [Asparagus officinalis]
MSDSSLSIFRFVQEQKFLQSDTRSPNNSSTGDNDDSGTIRNRVNQLTLIRSGQGNERLPGTVLQARARLLERLHGISLAESRQSIWAFNMSHNDSNGENDFGITDSREWEIETLQEWIESDVRFTDTAVDANQPVSLHDICKQKPPGLSLKTIYSLPQENFEDGQENESVLRASLECAICLERFQAGDRLLRLPCCHRFHPSCLEPWLQNFGDCPYCRASVKIC